MELAIKLLREKKADMVYPFDGRCYHVDRDILREYISTKEDNVLTANIDNLHCVYGIHTCGGAFLVNRNAYIEAGGDNEKFTGWGPEDLERFKRWEVRGYRVRRTEGAIFHMHHPRGENSRYFSQELKRSTIQALLETCREQGEYDDIYIPVYIFNLPDRTERKKHIEAQFEGRREFEPIIVESLCFYDGCTNAEKYIDPRAFVRIDISNIEESAQRIEQCVNDGYYEKQLPYILREKRRILYTLTPLNIIWAQLNGYDTTRYFLID